MTTYAITNTQTGADIVNAVNVLATGSSDIVTIQGGAGGTLKEYFVTPSGGPALKAKAGVTIIGDGKDRVRINTALQMPPGGSWSGSGPRWTWTGTIPGPTINTDIPSVGFLFPQMKYYETVYADGIPLWKIAVKDAGGTTTPAGRTASQVGTSVTNSFNSQPEPPDGPGAAFDGGGPLTSLYAGQCFIDYAAGTITVNVDPALHKIEVSRAGFNVFDSSNAGVSVTGVEAYGGSIGFRANAINHTYTDCRAYACSRGASVAPPADSLLMTRFEADWCHQYGLSGQGDFLVLDEPVIRHCNHAKLYASSGDNYGAGGSKFTGTGYVTGGTPDPTYGIVGGTGTPAAGSGVTVTATAGRYGLWEYNEGSGPWLDLSNVAVTIERQVVRHGGGHGVHYEVSYQGVVQDCYFYDLAMSGVYVSTSRDVTVQRNKLWLCGQGSSQRWLLRNNDVTRTQPALWGQHRGIKNHYLDNEVWMDGVSQNGGQGVVDNQGWSTNEWSGNDYHVNPALTKFNWDSPGAKTLAQWQVYPNPAGSADATHDSSAIIGAQGDAVPSDPWPYPPTPPPPPPPTTGVSLSTTGPNLYINTLP